MSASPVQNLELRQAQIIAAAMIAMVAVFASFGVYLVTQELIPAIQQVGLSTIFGATAAVIAVIVFIVPPIIGRAARGQTTSRLVSAWRTQNIVAMALCELACFLNTLALLLEQQMWSLGVIAFMLFLMLFHFPTQSGLDQFLDSSQDTDPLS